MQNLSLKSFISQEIYYFFFSQGNAFELFLAAFELEYPVHSIPDAVSK